MVQVIQYLQDPVYTKEQGKSDLNVISVLDTQNPNKNSDNVHVQGQVAGAYPNVVFTPATSARELLSAFVTTQSQQQLYKKVLMQLMTHPKYVGTA